MRVKEGQLVRIFHSRKGLFFAVAVRDFDTEVDEFFPVAVAEGYVYGLSDAWAVGEEIPCKARLVVRVEVL